MLLYPSHSFSFSIGVLQGSKCVDLLSLLLNIMSGGRIDSLLNYSHFSMTSRMRMVCRIINGIYPAFIWCSFRVHKKRDDAGVPRGEGLQN